MGLVNFATAENVSAAIEAVSIANNSFQISNLNLSIDGPEAVPRKAEWASDSKQVQNSRHLPQEDSRFSDLEDQPLCLRPSIPSDGGGCQKDVHPLRWRQECLPQEPDSDKRAAVNRRNESHSVPPPTQFNCIRQHGNGRSSDEGL